jgi:hypothetical protein
MFWCCNTIDNVVKPIKPDNKLVLNEIVPTESNPINYEEIISDTRPRLNSGFSQIILESSSSK